MLLNRVENAIVQNKRVLMTIDTNDLINNQNQLVFDLPLQQSVDTIELLINRGASIVLASECGSTQKPINLEIVAHRLGDLLKKKVDLVDLPLDSTAKNTIKTAGAGEIILLNNLYQYADHAKGSLALARELAECVDLYVNDAINSLSLETSIMLHFPALLPSCAGLHFYKAIEILENLDSAQNRPLVLVLGGNKVSEQIRLVKRFFEKVAKILFGGAVAYTFLKSRAVQIGNSVVDAKCEIAAFQMIEQAQLAEAETILPDDHLIADQFSNKAKTKVVGRNMIPAGWFGLSIGSKTLSIFEKNIKKAGTVLWHGPLGAIEFDSAKKTNQLFAKYLSNIKGQKIVIGHDTVFHVSTSGYAGKMDLCIYNSKTALELIHTGHSKALTALKAAK